MAVFNGVTRNEKRSGYDYFVYDGYLRDMQKYTREDCFVLKVLDAMIDEYSESEDELRSIRNNIEKVLTDNIVDAEELIEVRGMNKILYNLYNIIKNKN